jgi:hypothetical protein
MKSLTLITVWALVALTLITTSCRTPSRGFHNTDLNALVIQSFPDGTGQMLQPKTTARESNDQLLAEAAALPRHQTAVVILEDYYEEEIGGQFRDRGTAWVVGLRRLGYQHIVFLKGLGVPSPEGLITITQYY